MHKIRNKKLALLLTIVFVLTIMMPLATPASANTSYSALPPIPTVTAGEEATLGTLHIKIDPMANDSSALIALPSNYDIKEINGQPVVRETAGTLALGGSVTATVYNYDDNEFKLDIDAPATPDKVQAFITLRVAVPSGATGDVVAEITQLSGQLVSQPVVLAVVGKGTVTISCGTPEYIAGTGTVTFTVKENITGALGDGAGRVKFTLPKGFEWTGEYNIQSPNLVGNVTSDLNVDANNSRILELNVTGPSEDRTKSMFRFDAEIIVDELNAKYGDVIATIGGKSSVSPSKLTVAKYADFGIKLNVEDATEFLAGRVDQEIGNIVIEETAPESFIKGRSILLTLPTGAKWSAEIDTSYIDVTNTITPAVSMSSDQQTLRLILDEPFNKAGKIVLEEALVSTAVNFKGDLKVKVSGSAGVSGEVVVAKVNPSISVSADKPNVKIGVQGQAAGDLVITEAEAEALIHGKDLVISFVIDSGTSFDITPTVEVIEGDIEVNLKKSADKLILVIDSESTEASTIKISGITYTLSRAFPEGNVELKLGGSAVNEVGILFPNDTTVAKVVNAVCVTPAPGDSKQSATFVIGSSTYTLNGVEATMDVVPYVKDGRTYLPVRYVGYALGVAAENILWDGKTATLIKGDKVVQVTVGSKVMVVNGASINLDAAPELKDGRTMLPFRWIAWAFGASVNWDGASQTVTMEL